MDKHICPGCGAVYEITKHHSPMRDKDSIDCQFCKTEIIRWNGGVYYTSRLVKKGDGKPEDK